MMINGNVASCSSNSSVSKWAQEKSFEESD